MKEEKEKERILNRVKGPRCQEPPGTWKDDGEATNKKALVCYVSKRRERAQRGKKIRLRKGRRDQERKGAKKAALLLEEICKRVSAGEGV